MGSFSMYDDLSTLLSISLSQTAGEMLPPIIIIRCILNQNSARRSRLLAFLLMPMKGVMLGPKGYSDLSNFLHTLV